MPQIPWNTLVKMLRDALKADFDRADDPKYWSAVLKPEDGGAETKALVKEARLDAAKGLRLALEADGKPIVLEATPSSASQSRVKVDGALDPDARLVFALKGSFGNPTRYAFDFKNVTLDGEDLRVDTRFDP